MKLTKEQQTIILALLKGSSMSSAPEAVKQMSRFINDIETAEIEEA